MSANRLGQYVAAMRHVMGRTVVELAADASDAIDPVAVILMEHGRLSDEELNVNLLSGVATALHIPVSVLREIRNSGEAERSGTAPESTGLLHRILASLGPVTRPMANVLGSAAPGSTADLDLHVIDRPVHLASIQVADASGGLLDVTPVLEPDADRAPGYGILAVRVRDALGSPVVCRNIRLDLLKIEGLEDEEPVSTTGADGIARFPRVPSSLQRWLEWPSRTQRSWNNAGRFLPYHNLPHAPVPWTSRPGSRWRTRTRCHRGQMHEVVRLSTDGRGVYVCAVGRGPRQHVNKTYHVKVDTFLVGMEPLAGTAAR